MTGWIPRPTSNSSSICGQGHTDSNGKWVPSIDPSTGYPYPLLCGPDEGRVLYNRTVTQPNACGAPCPPDTYKEVPCYAPWNCCPRDCVIANETFSDCFGCGNNAVRFKKTIIAEHESCGGTPCCILEGTCSLFTVQTCDNPPPCPQTPCIWSEYGAWDACSVSCTADGQEPGQTCRYAYPVAAVNSTCQKKPDCQPCNSQCCPQDCEVGEWGDWHHWHPKCGLQTRHRSRPVTVPQYCHGSPCPPTLNHDTQYTNCSTDCVVDEWSVWSLCPTCIPEGATQPQTTSHRAILIQPANGGAACPTPRDDQHPCNSPVCDRPCLVTDWSNYSPCSAICGDGFKERTRNVTQTPTGSGMPCPALKDTDYCYNECKHCLVGPPEEDGACDHTCVIPGSGVQPKRRMRRHTTPITYTTDNGTVVSLDFCPGNDTTWLEDCFVPCCPIDCVMTAWEAWSDCIDGVRSRVRHVHSYPSCNGAPCPECLVEKDVCTSPPVPGECEFGEACEEGWSSDEAAALK